MDSISKILIAEDNERISALLELGLQENGFDTEVSATGTLALERLLEGSFDLCLLDLMLPLKDGMSVLVEAREQGVSLPIVIISVLGDRERCDLVLDKGANDFIDKPFSFNEILARVRAQLA